MSISTPFIRRPIATSLLTAAVFLAGLVAYPLLPVAPLPNVQFPTLTVTAQYPGASPETMASTVATPLETEFGQMLPGLAQMTSASVLGTTQITLQFDLSTDLGNAETLVLEAMNAAQGSLPKGMPTPATFRAINPSDSPILILAMQSDQAPITEVDNYAENMVEQQISQLPGVGQVLVGGQQTPAIRVQVDPGAAGLDGPDAGGRAHRPDQRHGRQSEGQHRRAEPILHDLCQRSADDGGAVQQHHYRLPQRCADPHPRYRPRRRRTRRIASWRRGPTASDRSC